MKDIIFTELLDYIKENVSDDFNLPDYLGNFISNMVTYNLHAAFFSWHEQTLACSRYENDSI